MAYFKKCLCGHLNIYEKKGEAPPICEKCSRQIISLPEELYTADVNNETDIIDSGYVLIAQDGQTFPILCGEQIVGRNSLCKEYLGSFPEVSREHFKITPRSSGMAVTLTDISAYGTAINGEKIPKNTPKLVSNGATIRLVNRATFILRYKGDEYDA